MKGLSFCLAKEGSMKNDPTQLMRLVAFCMLQVPISVVDSCLLQIRFGKVRTVPISDRDLYASSACEKRTR